MVVKDKIANQSVSQQFTVNIFTPLLFVLACIMMITAAARRSPETQEFMNIVFCLPIGQGYGATEARVRCEAILATNESEYADDDRIFNSHRQTFLGRELKYAFRVPQKM